MRRPWLDIFASLAVAFAVSASGIIYITDLPAFSSLAPCAAEGVSYVVQGLTNSECPAPVTALESCACTKDQNAAAIASTISSSVLQNCGSTATEDVTSASIVFSRYCNQGATVTTPSPTGPIVSQYVTDLPAYSDLAPCAAQALSYAVQPLTNNLCPGAQSALASCACTKNQNSLAASERINSLVYQDCGTTHTEDLTSAQAVFAGYCALGAGTTSFPTASALPGDISYYITDLPTFSSLAPCASNGLSYVVQAQTNQECPAAPGSLVSCACVKDQNSLALSSAIVSVVSQDCGSTASADITSALGVFDYYCSAGKGLVTPQGVTATTTGAASSGNSGQNTSPGYTYGPTATSGSGSGTGSGSGGSGSSGSSSSNSGNSVPIAPIAGGVVGGVFILAILSWVIWHYCNRRPPPPPVTRETGVSDHWGKSELPATSIAASAPRGPPTRKPVSNMDIQTMASPISPASEKGDTRSGAVELHGHWAPAGVEVSGDPSRYEMPGVRDAAELHNQYPHSELQDSSQNWARNAGTVYEMPDYK